MKFKTLRSSETGKKFLEIEKRALEAREACVSIAKELGFNQWRPDRWEAFGGIECLFSKEGKIPNLDYWKGSAKDGWTPKRNTKKGKDIFNSLKELPVVSFNDLNKCVDFQGAPFKHIGLCTFNPDFYLFTAQDDWAINVPKDCEEITVSEYNNLKTT